MNIVALSGRLTDSPVRRSESLVTFSVAIQRNVRQDDGSFKSEADFVDLLCTNGLGERVVQKLDKGSRVYVTGRLSQSKWQAQDGSTRSALRVWAQQIESEDFFQSASIQASLQEKAQLEAEFPEQAPAPKPRARRKSAA